MRFIFYLNKKKSLQFILHTHTHPRIIPFFFCPYTHTSYPKMSEIYIRLGTSFSFAQLFLTSSLMSLLGWKKNNINSSEWMSKFHFYTFNIFFFYFERVSFLRVYFSWFINSWIGLHIHTPSVQAVCTHIAFNKKILVSFFFFFLINYIKLREWRR